MAADPAGPMYPATTFISIDKIGNFPQVDLYNRIDGAVNNDVFGLSASGTNGGQTGIAPISIDAIDQFQVVLSPYDPSLGNFTGGGINAITKSGTAIHHAPTTAARTATARAIPIVLVCFLPAIVEV